MHVWWLLPLLFFVQNRRLFYHSKNKNIFRLPGFLFGFPSVQTIDEMRLGRALNWPCSLLLVKSRFLPPISNDSMVFCWCTSFGFLNSWESYFDFDGMTLRTPTGSPCKCKIILREASLGQQSVHWAPQLWSALRNIFIYLRFWEHLLETGHFSWMATSSFLSGMVTPAWSDMQLLGGSTWPVQAQWLIGGTCLGISPFISNGNQSLRQKSNIWHRQRRIWSAG